MLKVYVSDVSIYQFVVDVFIEIFINQVFIVFGILGIDGVVFIKF